MSQREVVEHRAWEVARQLAVLKRLYREKLGDDDVDGQILANLAIEIERLRGEFDLAGEELDSLDAAEVDQALAG